MKISAVSDVHIKYPSDNADRFLCSFLDHPEVINSEYILLLGDIFDLMCGPHEEYLTMYAHIFDRMDRLQKSGKKVYFFEGNHDVHLERLFYKRWSNKEIIVLQKPLIEKIDGREYYFSHGDEHEVDNVAYQRYKSFILSSPLKFVADKMLPYAVLNFVGERASKLSRKKGSRVFDEDLVKERFRKGVMETTQGKYDFVLGGHSHVKDLYQIPGTKELYINNGYALKSKTFLLIDNHEITFVPLA